MNSSESSRVANRRPSRSHLSRKTDRPSESVSSIHCRVVVNRDRAPRDDRLPRPYRVGYNLGPTRMPLHVRPAMTMKLPRRLCLSFFLVLFFAADGLADVRLPGFFGDHMVLQREAPIRIWGWAEAGESIEVAIGSAKVKTVADTNGRWSVELPARNASNASQTIRVVGDNTIVLNDVLIGEVWLCSGQSNMEWTVQSSSNAKEEIAAANHPRIRHIKIPRRPSTDPEDDIDADWQICSPESVGNFTACGYFMARKLQAELDVPIGLINSSWGGTRVEPWTPPIGFENVDALADIYRSVVGRTPGTPAYSKRLDQHVRATKDWVEAVESVRNASKRIAPSPAFPSELLPFESHQDPTMLYNGMIHAIVGFPIRGAIWYQGESNHGDGMLYYEKKRALIDGWRKLWGQGDFPFYYVQIAPFRYGDEFSSILPVFWEAQAAVQTLPNTGMVVINDIATLDNIHPPNKQDVGLRLALLALKNDYGREDVVARSPELEAAEIVPGKIKVTFRHTGGGLKTRDGKPATHFELIGPGSHGYKPATATIDGDTITLSSSDVKKPVALRFAWDKLAEPNLSGGTGLPVGAFRSGEEPDFLSLLSVEDDYQLVYDINLSKLNLAIRYDVDQSASIGPFDRVAYLLELRSDKLGEQSVFVSMDAFTDDATKIGIPSVDTGASFKRSVSSMDVFSTVEGVVTGTNLDSGSIEFWPNNYAPAKGDGPSNASDRLFDFGDDPGPPVDGYGSMQVHNTAAAQTIFAINHWSTGGSADLGIGNSPSQNPDWTFAGNAASYSEKRLRVYVRPK